MIDRPVRHASAGPDRAQPNLDRRRWLLTAGAGLFATSVRKTYGQERLESLYVADDHDRAVAKGVEFLAATQSNDGAIADRNNPVAMTALAIMAMASIGTEPSEPTPLGKTMAKAIDYVLQERHQNREGYFGDSDGSRMYGHGIVTLMLTEMLGMGSSTEQNVKIHDGLVRAISLILAAQAVPKPSKLQGGWRYSPTSRDSDLSVSVWQLMALRSAKNDGLAVPGEAIDSAVSYLRNSFTAPVASAPVATEATGGFSYTPGSYQPSFTMTSAGLLAMQVCGQYESPLVDAAAKWLLDRPPKLNERFFYYGIYYYSQGMHHALGEYSEVADQLTPELLLPEQLNNGSWLARSGEERNIGAVYATCLAILSLSVRYHYLPIYQR